MSNSIVNALSSASIGMIRACVRVWEAGEQVQRGVLRFAEAGSWAMWDIYSLEGFEKWSKAAISQMRMLELIPSIKGVFGECLKTVQGQRDIIYASLVFSSTADFIGKKTDKNGKSIYVLQLPREKSKVEGEKGKLDVVKFLYGIGNFFETGKFLQKYRVYSFSQFTQWANRLGSVKLFSLRGQNWTVGNVPVLKTLCDTPKDLLVFCASLWSVYKCFMDPPKGFWDVENLLKLTGNIGKVVLIGFAEYMLKKQYLIALCISDMVATHASLFAFWVKRNRERESRGLHVI